MFEQLPTELLHFISSQLTLQENINLKRCCKKLALKLAKIPSLHIRSYKDSCKEMTGIKDPSKFMKLSNGSINEESVLWLAQKGHYNEILRILSIRKFTQECIQQAFINTFSNAYYPHNIWQMIQNGPFHEIFTSTLAIKSRFNSYNPKVVQAFLAAGVDPSVENCSPFCASCYYGDIESVQKMLQDPRVDLTIQGNLPLINSILGNQPEVLKLLLKTKKVDVNDREGEAICIAAENNFLEIMDILLNCEEILVQQGENCPLESACNKNQVDMVKKLLQDERIDLNWNDGSALIAAIHEGALECVELLINDPRFDYNITPILFSMIVQAINGNEDYRKLAILKLLLQDRRLVL